jgi:hypothetical protein
LAIFIGLHPLSWVNPAGAARGGPMLRIIQRIFCLLIDVRFMSSKAALMLGVY